MYCGLDFDEMEDLSAYSEFKYEEALPFEIDGWVNNYILKTFLYTDAFVEVKNTEVYQLNDGKTIVFY